MSDKKEVPPRYEEIESHNAEPSQEKLTLKDKLSKLAVAGKIERKKREEELKNKINVILDVLFPTVEQLEMVAKKGSNKYNVLHIKKYSKYNTYHFMNNTRDIKQIRMKINDIYVDYSITTISEVAEIDHARKKISCGYIYRYFLNRCQELGLNVNKDSNTITLTW